MSYVRKNFCCYYYYYYCCYCYFKWFDLNFLFIVEEETLVSLTNPSLNVLCWKNTDTLLSISSQTVLLLKYLTSCHVIPSCTYSSYGKFQWKLVTLKKGCFLVLLNHYWLAIVCGVGINVGCPFNVLYYVTRLLHWCATRRNYESIIHSDLAITNWHVPPSLLFYCFSISLVNLPDTDSTSRWSKFFCWFNTFLLLISSDKLFFSLVVVYNSTF